MPLKKPSDFFNKKIIKESLGAIREEMDSADLSESFTAYRKVKSNLNNIQSLDDFSSSFGSFKENVKKVEELTSDITQVKEEIQDLIKKKDFDDAMVAHLFFAEEAIGKIEKKAVKINKEAVDKVNKDFSILSNSVNEFIDEQVPAYKRLISESENRVDQRFVNFTDSLDSKVDDINQEVFSNLTKITEEVDSINENHLSSIKEDVELIGDKVNTLYTKDLPVYKKFFAETEIRTDEKLSEAQDTFNEKIEYVNETYQKRIDELNSIVKEFTDVEVPKYSNLLAESKIKSEEERKALEQDVIKRIESLTSRIESHSSDIAKKSDNTDLVLNDFEKLISETKDEVKDISESYISFSKDFRKRDETLEGSLKTFSERIDNIEKSLGDDVCELQENLDTSTSKYYETLNKKVDEFEGGISDKLIDLVINFNRNEKHIGDLREEFQDIISKLNLDTIEKNNKELTDKITHIEEVFEKFNEKTVLTEDIPYTQVYAENAKGYIDNPTVPGKPSNQTSDPLTQLDQDFVTLDQLQSHYRIFINRIQTQLATIGGGGAGFIKDLDDVDFDQSVGTNKLLIYDGTQWVGIASTALSGGTDSTLDDILGNGSETTKGMSVGVITATSGFFSGILTAASLNYDVVTDIYSTGIVTATKGIQITTLGLNIASGIATLTDGLRVGSAATISANGNATFSGIVTATSFTGDGTGLTGVASTDNIQTGTPATFLSNVNITGVATATGGLNVGTAATIYANGNIAAAGIVTANGGFVGSGANITSISGSNIASGTVAAARVATLNQNTSGTAAGLTGSPSVELTNVVGAAASIAGIVTATTFKGALIGNVTGNTSGSSGSCSGNAATATILETARDIGGVSFNGSAPITLPGVNASGNQNTSGTSAGLTGSPSVELTNIVGAAASVVGIVTATTFSGALTGNVTGNTSGSSGSCTGNAATATILATARDIGGVSFNGSASINLPGVNQAGNQNTTGTAAGITEADTAVSSTSATTVLSFAHASYRGAFVSLSITQGSNYQIGKYSIIHDGTTVTVTEEFSVATGSMLGSFSGTISSSNLLFQVTMGSSDSSTITVKADKITV